MKSQKTAAAISTVLVLNLCAPGSAQWLKHPTPGIPRTADGKPDLGVYETTDPEGKPQTFAVSVAGDRLMVQPPTGGKFPLVAESDTRFSVAGAPIEFFKDAQSRVTHFVVRTVEGDQKATRKKTP